MIVEMGRKMRQGKAKRFRADQENTRGLIQPCILYSHDELQMKEELKTVKAQLKHEKIHWDLYTDRLRSIIKRLESRIRLAETESRQELDNSKELMTKLVEAEDRFDVLWGKCTLETQKRYMGI